MSSGESITILFVPTCSKTSYKPLCNKSPRLAKSSILAPGHGCYEKF